jgi:hypothetical protein
MMKYRTNKYFLSIAYILLLCFMVESSMCVPYVESAYASHVQSPLPSLTLPLELGRVQDSYVSKKSNAPFIVCIQNAHANYEAQKNIQDILAYYQKECDLSTLFVEGSTGEIDASFFRAFPLQDVKKKIIDEYVQAGRISGVEEYAITGEREVTLHGIENEELYLSHLELLTRIVRDKDRIARLARSFERSVEEILAETLPDETRRLLSLKTAFETDEKADALEYMRALLLHAQKEGISLQTFPHAMKLQDVDARQRAINHERVMSETKKIITEILLQRATSEKKIERLAYLEMDYRASRIDPYLFYSELKTALDECGENIESFKDVSRFFESLRLAAEIDPAALLKERIRLERKIFNARALTKNEKELLQVKKVMESAQRFLLLQATPRDMRYFRKNKKYFDADFLNAFLTKYQKERLPFEWQERISDSEAFYSYAEARETYMVANTLNVMKTKTLSSGALILGGYHAQGISAALKKHDISFVVVAPRMTHVPKENLYEKIVSEYDSLFGIKEGENAGTIEKFSEIAVLELSQRNLGLVKKLFTEIRARFIDELHEIHSIDASKEYSDYYAEWNKNAKEWTIVEYDADGKAFFIQQETLKKALKDYSFQELEAVIKDFGDVVSSQDMPEDAYMYTPKDEELETLSTFFAGSPLSKDIIRSAIQNRKTLHYLRSTGFSSGIMAPMHEDQLLLIQTDFEKMLKKKEEARDYTIRLYAAGLGEEPKEIVDLVKAIDWAIHKNYPGRERDWTVEIIGIDLHSKPIQRAHAVFKALHDNDFTVTFPHPRRTDEFVHYFEQPLHVVLQTSFFQADILDLERLKNIAHGRKGDYILNRYGSLDNLNVATGNVSREKLNKRDITNVNVFLTLHNLLQAFAGHDTRYITEPLNDQTIGFHALKNEEDIPVLRIPGGELYTANMIMESTSEKSNIPDDSLINRGTGMYRILYPGFMERANINSFLALIEAQKDVSLSGQVQKSITRMPKEKHERKIRETVPPYRDDTSLVRRDMETGVKPKLSPVIMKNLERGEMLVCKRIDMHNLIQTLEDYLARPDEEKKDAIINMMIYGMHLKPGKPNYRAALSDWFHDVETNRLAQYLDALHFVRDVLQKPIARGLLTEDEKQARAEGYLQSYDAQYMILPSFLGADALGHIDTNGIYLSLEKLMKARRESQRSKTYNGFSIDTIMQTILLHEASDHLTGYHVDDIPYELFKAIDLFWSTESDTYETKSGEIISLQQKRTELLESLYNGEEFIVFPVALRADVRLKMQSRVSGGEDDYAVYSDYASRGYFSAFDEPVLSEAEFRNMRNEYLDDMRSLLVLYPELKGYSFYVVTGLDEPLFIDRKKKALYVDLRTPQYFFGLSVIYYMEQLYERGINSLDDYLRVCMKQAAYLEDHIAGDRDTYFKELQSEYEFSDDDILSELSAICFLPREEKESVLLERIVNNKERYSADMRDEALTLLSKNKDVAGSSLASRPESKRFKTIKASREYFYEKAIAKLEQLYPEITGFEKEALRKVLIYKSDFHKQAREDMLFLSVLSRLMSINDVELLLSIGVERERDIEVKVAAFSLEDLYKKIRNEIETMRENGLKDEEVLALLSDGVSYEMISRYAKRRGRTVAYILGLNRKQGFHATDILDEEYQEFICEEPVLIVQYQNGKSEAFVTFRGVKYAFSLNPESTYYESLERGKIVFKGDSDEIVITDLLRDEEWRFPFKEIDGKKFLCDLNGETIGSDITYVAEGERKHAAYCMITNYIPAWAQVSEEEKIRYKIKLLGSYKEETSRKAMMKRFRAVAALLKENNSVSTLALSHLKYIADVLENKALATYFQKERKEQEINDALANFYSENRIAFKEALIRETYEAYTASSLSVRDAMRDVAEKSSVFSPYGAEIFIELFGVRGESLDDVGRRLEELFRLMEEQSLSYSGMMPHESAERLQREDEEVSSFKGKGTEIAFYLQDDETPEGSKKVVCLAERMKDDALPKSLFDAYPNAQAVRNALKKKREKNEDYSHLLKRSSSDGGDSVLLKACYYYDVPVRIKGRRNLYATPREALKALLLVEPEKRSSTFLKKGESEGGNSYLKVRASKMRIPLPVVSLEKYPTKESALKGLAEWRAKYPQTPMSATFLIKNDAALLNALRRDAIPYDSLEVGRDAVYKDISEMYEALMAIPFPERTCRRLSLTNAEGGNSRLLHLYYQNKVALNEMGCFLFNEKLENTRIYKDRESTQKGVNLYRAKYGMCTSKMLRRPKSKGGSWALLSACRRYDVALDHEEEDIIQEGYSRYRASVLKSREALIDEDIELLWYMMNDGDAEAEAKFIEYSLGCVIDVVEERMSGMASINFEKAYELDDKISAGNVALFEALKLTSDFGYHEFTRLYKGEEKAVALTQALDPFIPIDSGIDEFDSAEWSDVPLWLNEMLHSDVPFRILNNYQILSYVASLELPEELRLYLQELTGISFSSHDLRNGKLVEYARMIQEKHVFLQKDEVRRLKRLIIETFFPKLCPKSIPVWRPGSTLSIEDSLRDVIRNAIKRATFYHHEETRVTDYLSDLKGNKGGNSNDGGRKRTLEDHIGTEDDNTFERLEVMREKLAQIRKDDFTFLNGTGFEFDKGIVLSPEEKDAFLIDLRNVLIAKDIPALFKEPSAMWLVGSMGHIGIARKYESDINLLIVTEASQKECHAIAEELERRLGGAGLEMSSDGNYVFTIGNGLNWDAMFSVCPDMLALSERHKVGKKGRLASIEIVSLATENIGESAVTRRARFHVEETLCEVSQNARAVWESDENVYRHLGNRLRTEVNDSAYGYEYFMAEYQLSFFAKQVVRLQEYEPLQQGLKRPDSLALRFRDPVTRTSRDFEKDDFLVLYNRAFSLLTPEERVLLSQDLKRWDGYSVIDIQAYPGFQKLARRLFGSENKDYIIYDSEYDGSDFIPEKIRHSYTINSLILFGYDYLGELFRAREREADFLSEVLQASVKKSDTRALKSLVAQLIEKQTHDDVVMLDTVNDVVRDPRLVSDAPESSEVSALVLDEPFLKSIEAFVTSGAKPFLRDLAESLNGYDKIFMYVNKENVTRDPRLTEQAIKEKFMRIFSAELLFPSDKIEFLTYENQSAPSDFSFLGERILSYDRVVVLRSEGKSNFYQSLKSAARLSVSNQVRVITGREILPLFQNAALMREIGKIYAAESTPTRRIFTEEAWRMFGYFWFDSSHMSLIRSGTSDLAESGSITARLVPDFTQKLTRLNDEKVIRSAA